MKLVKDQIYSFNYAGGSRPNELRYAYIISTDGYAWDLESQCFKRFSTNKMRNVTKVYPNDTIELSKLPRGIHPETLVDSYILDGELAYYDKNRNVIFVVRKAVDRSKITFSATGVTFVSSNGLFYLSGANGFYAASIAGKGYYSLSAKEAMAKLAMFLAAN